jgi:hypothetical protein
MLPISCEIESLRDIGEYVVVVGPSRVGAVEPADDSHVSDVFGRLTNGGQFSESQALSMTAAGLSMKESDVRKALKRDRIRVNRLRDALS